MNYDKLLGKVHIQAEIECKTGLHIGGTTKGIEIGGLDNPVIKDPLTEQPYIPGSSLRGKLRSLLEWSHGLIALHPKHQGYAAYACPELELDRAQAKDPQRWDSAYLIGRLFGASSDDTTIRRQAGPSRLLVRDAFPTKDTQADWAAHLGENIYTEVKTENALDRLTAEANPRPMERVPAGSRFGCEMFLDIYLPEDAPLVAELLAGMLLLEHSALGGSGSRGSGQIVFRDVALLWLPLAYYRGQEKASPLLPAPAERPDGHLARALEALRKNNPLTGHLGGES